MIHPIRVIFRSLTDGDELGAGHIQRISRPHGGVVRSIYAKAHHINPSEDGEPAYRVRIYGGDPASSCWQLELQATSLGEDSRTPDVLHQGIEVYLPDMFWLTYELVGSVASTGARLELEMLLEGARG